MNYYDDEENIIQLLQFVESSKVNFVNITCRSLLFWESLHNEELFKNWINSSGKDVPPPDFYSKKYKYMLEVMRVDDFVIGKQSPNAIESKYLREVDNYLRENGNTTLKESNIQMLVIPRGKNISENSYATYVENFRRVAKKHLEKISEYRRNHPKYKLGFLVFDESAGYIQVEDPGMKRKPGDAISGIIHSFCYDRKFIEVFDGYDLDFLVWMTPNKNSSEKQQIFPNVSIFDLKCHNKWRKRLMDFDCEKTICMEVRG